MRRHSPSSRAAEPHHKRRARSAPSALYRVLNTICAARAAPAAEPDPVRSHRDEVSYEGMGRDPPRAPSHHSIGERMAGVAREQGTEEPWSVGVGLDRLEGRLYWPTRPGPWPVVVLGPALGYRAVDPPVPGVARAIARHGAVAVAIDYRCWGSSGGLPRHLHSLPQQRDDLVTALAAARVLTGVDGTRAGCWAWSYGAAAAVLAARDLGDLRGLVLRNPFLSGTRYVASLLGSRALPQLVRVVGAGLLDALGDAAGRDARYAPLVGPRGASAAVFWVPGPGDGYRSLAEQMPGFAQRNFITPRSLLRTAFHRVQRHAWAVRARTLLTVGDADTIAFPAVARAYARKAPAAERHVIPGTHFSIHTDELAELEAAWLVAVLQADDA
jgi:uncharacterized protein